MHGCSEDFNSSPETVPQQVNSFDCEVHHDPSCQRDCHRNHTRQDDRRDPERRVLRGGALPILGSPTSEESNIGKPVRLHHGPWHARSGSSQSDDVQCGSHAIPVTDHGGYVTSSDKSIFLTKAFALRDRLIVDNMSLRKTVTALLLLHISSE